MHNCIQRYVKECPHCSNVVEGKIKRGLIRGTLHDGPAAVVDLIPVGGKLVWKGMKEVVKILLRTDIRSINFDPDYINLCFVLR